MNSVIEGLTCSTLNADTLKKCNYTPECQMVSGLSTKLSQSRVVLQKLTDPQSNVVLSFKFH